MTSVAKPLPKTATPNVGASLGSPTLAAPLPKVTPAVAGLKFVGGPFAAPHARTTNLGWAAAPVGVPVGPAACPGLGG